ncbi:MAG TPA: hypothetical protein VGH13_11600 [Xanthobacteraceae bacterium]
MIDRQNLRFQFLQNSALAVKVSSRTHTVGGFWMSIELEALLRNVIWLLLQPRCPR